MLRSMLFFQARPGHGSEVLRALERLGVLAMAREQPGFLGVEVATSVDDEDEIVIIGSWASREHYVRWREGPAPAELGEQLEDHVVSPPVERVYHIVEAVS